MAQWRTTAFLVLACFERAHSEALRHGKWQQVGHEAEYGGHQADPIKNQTKYFRDGHSEMVMSEMVMSILLQCGTHDTILINILDAHYAQYLRAWRTMISSSKLSFASPFVITLDMNATISAQTANVPYFDAASRTLHKDIQTDRKTLTRFLPAGLGGWKFMSVSAGLKAQKRVIMTEMDVLYDPRATFSEILSSNADYTGMISGNANIYNAGFFMTQGSKAEAFFGCLLKEWLEKPSDVLAVDQMFMNAHIRRSQKECIRINHTALNLHTYSCCRRWHKNKFQVEVGHITYCRRLSRQLDKEDRCKENIISTFYADPFSLAKLEYIGEQGSLVPGC